MSSSLQLTYHNICTFLFNIYCTYLSITLYHSVFDAARFALSQYVSIHTDYPIAYADRVGVATCECCGRLFIKNGNHQKYCDNPECKKEQNRRKSRTAYRRKIQEERDNRWV